MPIIPTRSETRNQLAPDRPVFQSSAGATPDAFGAAEARGLQQLAGGLGSAAADAGAIFSDMQRQDNEREAKQLDIEFSQRMRELAYGDGQNPGFYSQRGEDAINGHEGYEDAVERARNELSNRASNDRVRQMFSDVSHTRTRTEYDKAARYVLEQRTVAADTLSAARIQEASDDAAAAYNDPAILKRSLSLAVTEVAEQGERNGWSEAVTQSQIEVAQTAILKQAIDAALVSDPAMAREIFEANKGQIDGTMQAQIEKALKTGNLRIQGQQATDGIMAQGLSETEALAEARKIQNAELRDDVVQRVLNRYAERAHATKRAKDGAAASAFGALINGGSLDQWISENPDEFQLIAGDGPLMASIQTAERRVAEGQLFANATDGQSLATLRSMEPIELANIELDAWRHRLTRDEFNTATTLVAGAKSAIRSDKENTAVHSAGYSALKKFAPKSLKFGSEKASTNDRKVARAAMNEMTAWIDSYINQHGRKPSQDEINHQAELLMLDINSDPGAFLGFLGFGDLGVAAQVDDLTEDELEEVRVDVDDVPTWLRAEIEARARQHNVQLTEDLLEQLAGALATRNPARARRLLGIE